ncbi:hypothetical protein B4U80_13726, partial [Leptotrombidium deliense]
TPEVPRNCMTSNADVNKVTVNCTPGFDGGLEQTFHMEAFRESNSQLDIISIQSSIDRPIFTLNNLEPNVSLLILIYASNEKGKSEKFKINGNTLQAFKWKKVPLFLLSKRKGMQILPYQRKTELCEIFTENYLI